MERFIKLFGEIQLNDLQKVGGKNASLGEMFQKLSSKGIDVPDGFATTADTYWHFLETIHIKDKLNAELSDVLEKAHRTGTKIGLCGQAPSDYPEYGQF